MALNSEQIDKLKLLLLTSGWNDVILPVIQNRARQALEALRLDPEERAGQWKGKSDQSIRDRLTEIEFLASVWHNEIAVFDANKRQEEILAERDHGAEAPEETQAAPSTG